MQFRSAETQKKIWCTKFEQILHIVCFIIMTEIFRSSAVCQISNRCRHRHHLHLSTNLRDDRWAADSRSTVYSIAIKSSVSTASNAGSRSVAHAHWRSTGCTTIATRVKSSPSAGNGSNPRWRNVDVRSRDWNRREPNWNRSELKFSVSIEHLFIPELFDYSQHKSDFVLEIKFHIDPAIAKQSSMKKNSFSERVIASSGHTGQSLAETVSTAWSDHTIKSQFCCCSWWWRMVLICIQIQKAALLEKNRDMRVRAPFI